MGRKRLIDLSGQTFGSYKVLRPYRRSGSFICLCQGCGREKVVCTHHLLSGHSTQCHGCSTRIKWEGKKVGHITVLKYLGSPDKNQSRYLCKCDCGKEFIIRGDGLKKNITCGCSSWGHKNRSGNLSFSMVYTMYRSGAKRKNRSFNLSKDQFKKITSQNCYYCGIKPSNAYTAGQHLQNAIPHPTFIYNGIDRIDSSKGYEMDNIVPCCIICNQMKNDLSQEDFYNHLKKILSWRYQNG